MKGPAGYFLPYFASSLFLISRVSFPPVVCGMCVCLDKKRQKVEFGNRGRFDLNKVCGPK
jgi:hypothetical protein